MGAILFCIAHSFAQLPIKGSDYQTDIRFWAGYHETESGFDFLIQPQHYLMIKKVAEQFLLFKHLRWDVTLINIIYKIRLYF